MPAPGRSRTSSGASGSPYEHPHRSDFSHIPRLYLEVDGEIEEFPDFPAIAKAYAEGVVNGRVIACRFVKLACQRYLRMLRRSVQADSPYLFSPAHAVDFLSFWESMPIGDNWQGRAYAELEPWQIWVGCAIYGFRRKDKFLTRWVNWVYLEIPRKHAKSGTAAIIGLYDMIASLGKEPKILIGAASEQQADHVFRAAARCVFDEPELQDAYKIEVNQKIIRCEANRGSIEKVASIPKNQDGWNPSTVVLDELHSQNPGLYQVLKSAMGARSNQLMFQITTAGRHAYGLGWDERANAIRVLEGKDEDDRMFAAIYTVDAEDLEDQKRLLTDERVWIKANPMWGVSIDPDTVRSLAAKAVFSPIDREEFLRTRLNVWSNAATTLVDPHAWNECEDPELDISQMFGRACWIAVDLSYYLDMTAIALMFEEDDEGRVPLFVRFFLPATSPLLQNPVLHAMMMDWVEKGFLTLQDSQRINTDLIAEEIKSYHEVFEVQEVVYDKAAGGDQMMRRLFEEGYTNLSEYPNSPAYMTAPTEELLSRIASRTLVHDGNECLRWHMMNVVGDFRANGTVLPKKDAPNSDRKVDGFVAAVMANGSRMGTEAIKRRKGDKKYHDPYLHRGIIGFQEGA